ncbi:MAG TPA: hypothetical protein VI277_01165 [Candidatus Limnocylindria bacterium]
MTTRTRQVLAGAFIGGGVLLALAIPMALRMPLWVPLVTVVLALIVLGPIYDRILHG